MTADKKRIEWIDILKCICMFFVMVSHVSSKQKIAPDLEKFYLPFFLTGFLFASGYTYRFEEGFTNHLSKKTKQLLIPWFMYSVANILLSQILTFNPDSHFGLFTDLFRNFLQIRNYNDWIWFVNALFVAYIPFYFFIKKYKKDSETNPSIHRKYLLFCVCLFFGYELYDSLMPSDFFPWKRNGLPWHLEYVPYAICYMFIGYLYKNKFEKESDTNYSLIVTALYFSFVGLSYFENELNIIIRITLSLIRNNLGIAFIVLLSKNISPSRIMLFIGRNTLTYFAIHIKALVLWEKIFGTIYPTLLSEIYSSRVYSAFYSLIVCLVMCFVLVLPTKIINKYFPFMIGRGYKKSSTNQIY